MIGIYKITNKVNNKCYIGQSRRIQERWIKHLSNVNTEKYYYKIYKAFKKYGIENFSFEVIEECKEEELSLKEKYWIKFYDSYYNGYNMTEGGEDSLWKEAIKKTSKVVQQYDKNNNFIKEYKSAHEAQQITGICFSNICKVCRGERPYAGGFKWKFKQNNI